MPLPLLPLVLDAVPEGLRLALAQEGVPCQNMADGNLDGRFVLHDSRNQRAVSLAEGQTSIDVDTLRRGFDGDPLQALIDIRAETRAWRIGPLAVVEEVARRDKRSIRRQVLGTLRKSIEAAGGVWLRTSPFPYPYRSAFNFRLDHDAFVPADFEAVLAAIAGHEGATTHYVCAATHEPHTNALARLRGLDVGSHGYWHHTYVDPQENLRNIRRGIETLHRAGIEARGFAAPHGRWSVGLGRVMEYLGVSHSSEFALAYDELPFVPVGGGPLQVPIHPVCLGIALEAARRAPDCRSLPLADVAELVLRHFHRVVDSQHRAGEPAFLYGHPDGRIGCYPRVLREMLRQASGLPGMWCTTHSRFADWWRRRAEVRWRVLGTPWSFTVMVDQLADGYRAAVEHWRGECVTRIPLDGPVVRLSPCALSYEPCPSADLPPAEPAEGSAGLRGRVLRYLDWEKVTPTSEIRARGWRGWVKRSLRRVR